MSHDNSEGPKRTVPRSYDEMFPGRFMKAGLFRGKEVTLTVTGAITEELEGNQGMEVRGILQFAETKKELVINKTNSLCLAAMFGTDPQALVGKRITFMPEKTSLEGREVDGVRIKGSPELTEPIKITIKFFKKRAFTRTLVPTGKAAQQ